MSLASQQTQQVPQQEKQSFLLAKHSKTLTSGVHHNKGEARHT